MRWIGLTRGGSRQASARWLRSRVKHTQHMWSTSPCVFKCIGFSTHVQQPPIHKRHTLACHRPPNNLGQPRTHRIRLIDQSGGAFLLGLPLLTAAEVVPGRRISSLVCVERALAVPNRVSPIGTTAIGQQQRHSAGLCRLARGSWRRTGHCRPAGAAAHSVKQTDTCCTTESPFRRALAVDRVWERPTAG